mmetsp:Transcript_10519/g.12114  ORF Transcript_10519/g.12114 Transcript_10519/m.12114 type:complete len:103 (-) Transcript_10519:7-315(-)
MPSPALSCTCASYASIKAENALTNDLLTPALFKSPCREIFDPFIPATLLRVAAATRLALLEAKVDSIFHLEQWELLKSREISEFFRSEYSVSFKNTSRKFQT